MQLRLVSQEKLLCNVFLRAAELTFPHYIFNVAVSNEKLIEVSISSKCAFKNDFYKPLHKNILWLSFWGLLIAEIITFH